MAITINSSTIPQVSLPKLQPASVQKTVATPPPPPHIVVDTVKISQPAQSQQVSTQAHGTSDTSIEAQNASNIGSPLASSGPSSF